ncbi:hypothetical protein VTJ83DRAFT_5834 [Remersonia thermophila]|uniref:Zn(2)-C6 fungal-type domain-containing protein n=1 Tax=Remersonia thermophila TaxID=72144 RepID=A0ABR4D7Z5_9PEZI
MTPPTSSPAVAAVAAAAKDAASARKRRRRAPAGGAADDCFTCAKRNVKCDRRRPYCSQCLEIGNECSGYKTQLTWGVGVASRGKLRGLSLPIAKAPPVNPPKMAGITKTSAPAKSRTPNLAPPVQPLQQAQQPQQQQQPAPPAPQQQQQQQQQQQSQWPTEHPQRAVKEEVMDTVMDMGVGHRRNPPVLPPVSIPAPAPPFHPYDMSHLSPTEPVPAGWTHMPFSPAMPAPETTRFPPRSLHIPATTAGDMMQRELIQTPIDTMSEVDYMSPLSHSFPRDDMPPYIHSPVVYEGFPTHASPMPPSPVAAMMIEQSRPRPPPPPPCPSLVYAPSETSSSLHSHFSHVESLEAQLSRRMPHECDVLIPGTPDLDAYGSSVQSHGTFWASSSSHHDEEDPAQDKSLAPWTPQPFPSQSPPPPVLQVSSDLIAKMPFFMDYYEKTMCPGMVFIDGPANPFREHILRLSTSSRSLQHAICALAACNLRMKRKLSLGQHGPDMGERRLDMSPIDGGAASDLQPADQSLAEEYQHRNLAVRLLNEQLNDAEKSTHDSVLATILILCHYRMAESGVAKFQTQFAGVRKILSLRRLSPYPPSRDSAWMEALFTYFDAISASVNDREPQLTASFFGVPPDANPLPLGVENLVGCDRDLFRTVSKLGRLNLLSQHRPVEPILGAAPPSSLSRVGVPSARTTPPLGAPFKPPPPSSSSSSSSSLFPGQEQHHHLHPHQQHQHHSLFGGVPHPISSGVRFDGHPHGGMAEGDDMMGSHAAPAAFDDPRSTFWREWKEARQALQSWQFDAARVRASLMTPLPPTSSSPSSPPTTAHSMGSSPLTPPGASPSPPHMMSPASHHPHHHHHHHHQQSPSPAELRDLASLSEAFRYAALLYTERLASPNVPSNHNTFRNLVSQVVYYATSLEAGSAAEKFLLWPLFVAGSECVNELQQNIVRSKCKEIMARSGYMNNMAALQVLERVWAGEESAAAAAAARNGLAPRMMAAGGAHGGKGGRPFNWAKCIGGPGVDVEWIMF